MKYPWMCKGRRARRRRRGRCPATDNLGKCHRSTRCPLKDTGGQMEDRLRMSQRSLSSRRRNATSCVTSKQGERCLPRVKDSLSRMAYAYRVCCFCSQHSDHELLGLLENDATTHMLPPGARFQLNPQCCTSGCSAVTATGFTHRGSTCSRRVTGFTHRGSTSRTRLLLSARARRGDSCNKSQLSRCLLKTENSRTYSQTECSEFPALTSGGGGAAGASIAPLTVALPWTAGKESPGNTGAGNTGVRLT